MSKAPITVGSGPKSQMPSGSALTLMTYNIRMGVGGQREPGKLFDMPWGRHLDRVVAEIESVGPDIAGLQEVAGPDQAADIAHALGLNFAYVAHETTRSTGRWWGVAILSKYPIQSARSAEISFGRGNQRTVLIATLRVGTRTLTALSIHKDKDLHDSSSIRNIMNIVAPLEGPVILLGDFNFTPKKSKGRLELIETRFIDAATAVDTTGARAARRLGTFVRSKRRIDYVFVDRDAFEVRDAGVTRPVTPASDHRAFYARVKWK